MPRRRLLPLVALVAVLGVACAGASGGTPPSSGTGPVAAEVASVDLFAGPTQHVQIGLFTADQQQGIRPVSYGSVEVAFGFLGVDGSSAPEAGPSTTARYVPAYGTDDSGTSPAVTSPDLARGTYQADVSFDRPGVWVATVTADVEGLGTQRPTAAFRVAQDPSYPAPGDRAPRTRNLTADSKGVPITAIDSAATDGTLPDPALHRWTLAEAIAERRPVVLIVGTPAFCESRMCGPEVDALEDLSARFGDRAVFIHIEIWKRFTPEEKIVNRGAAEWVFRHNDVTDPWTFLIGADGRIVDRWMPLIDPGELAAVLRALPRMPA